jgi:hypothetical protein
MAFVEMGRNSMLYLSPSATQKHHMTGCGIMENSLKVQYHVGLKTTIGMVEKYVFAQSPIHAAQINLWPPIFCLEIQCAFCHGLRSSGSLIHKNALNNTGVCGNCRAPWINAPFSDRHVSLLI